MTVYNLGNGADSRFGSTGADTIYGNGGDDRLDGKSGIDLIYGGSGNDFIELGTGSDKAYGGTGDDWIYAGHSASYGEDGGATNSLNGDAGNDILIGDTGTDVLAGGDGNDYLTGGNALYGQPLDGNDRLYGGNGNDSLWGGTGNDQMTGGAGNDHFQYSFERTFSNTSIGGGQDVILDFNASQDRLELSYDATDPIVYGSEYWDTNHNGKVDGADSTADMVNYTLNGVTKASLLIYGESVMGSVAGTNTLLLYGVTSVADSHIDHTSFG